MRFKIIFVPIIILTLLFASCWNPFSLVNDAIFKPVKEKPDVNDLIGINKLDFDPWMNPIDLEILSAEIKDDFVLITCNQHDNDLDFCEGKLMISANDFKLFDHNSKQMTINQLDSICKKYWNNAKNSI